MDISIVAVCQLIVHVSLIVFIILILLFTFQRFRKYRVPGEKISESGPILRTCIILGSGGHTTEMLRLVSTLNPSIYTPRHYILAATDSTSEKKVVTMEKSLGAGDYHLNAVPRSREVRQSYLSSVFSTLHACLACFPLMFHIRPHLILANGPGTCIPPIICAYLLDLFCINRVRVVCVESMCRVQTLSLTGLLCYYLPICDEFIVQWKELQQRYPKSIYLGRL